MTAEESALDQPERHLDYYDSDHVAEYPEPLLAGYGMQIIGVSLNGIHINAKKPHGLVIADCPCGLF